MAKRTTTRAKNTIKAGAESVKSVAGEAIGAAMVTGAAVVLERVAQALSSGAKNVEQSKPAALTAVRKVAAPKRGRKAKSKKKAAGQRKPARKKKRAKAKR